MNKPMTIDQIRDTRNVVDYYKGMATDLIMGDLDTKRFNYSILCCNILGDFNISSVIRASNAFLAKEVFIFGRKKFDVRGTVGTHNYTHLKHVKEVSDLDAVFGQFDLVVSIDNIDGAISIEDKKWDATKKTLFIFGEEQVGIPKEVVEKSHETVFIKQYGSVRSLNVAQAASIVMFSYCSQINKV